jgi:hypothetical protein
MSSPGAARIGRLRKTDISSASSDRCAANASITSSCSAKAICANFQNLCGLPQPRRTVTHGSPLGQEGRQLASRTENGRYRMPLAGTREPSSRHRTSSSVTKNRAERRPAGNLSVSMMMRSRCALVLSSGSTTRPPFGSPGEVPTARAMALSLQYVATSFSKSAVAFTPIKGTAGAPIAFLDETRAALRRTGDRAGENRRSECSDCEGQRSPV